MNEHIDVQRTTPPDEVMEAVKPKLDRLADCIEMIRQTFDGWDDPYAKGPGLYFILEASSVSEFVAPVGSNRWPVDDRATVFDDALFEPAKEVAFECDGAVVVHEDGTIASEMVRVEALSADEDVRVEDLNVADWMSARQRNALETSLRPEVDAVLTLSETEGRTTVFRSGRYVDHPRDTTSDLS